MKKANKRPEAIRRAIVFGEFESRLGPSTCRWPEGFTEKGFNIWTDLEPPVNGRQDKQRPCAVNNGNLYQEDATDETYVLMCPHHNKRLALKMRGPGRIFFN